MGRMGRPTRAYRKREDFCLGFLGDTLGVETSELEQEGTSCSELASKKSSIFENISLYKRGKLRRSERNAKIWFRKRPVEVGISISFRKEK